MGVFHVFFKIVQMLRNRTKHRICNLKQILSKNRKVTGSNLAEATSDLRNELGNV